MKKTNQYTSYKICLANGQRWSILELNTEKSHKNSRLIFLGKEIVKQDFSIKINDIESDMRERSFVGGWWAYELQALRWWFHPEIPDTICEIIQVSPNISNSMRMSEALYPICHFAQQSRGLLLHAALIERDGIGVLLAGHTNVGKSTCCQRIPSPWLALCDDLTLIVCDEKGRYFAHPFPTWSDCETQDTEKTWNVQYYLPISAVFFLRQAEADDIECLGEGQASVLMSESAFQVSQRFWFKQNRGIQREKRREIFSNACETAKMIPAFTLRVSLEGKFWEKIEEVLN